LEGWRFFTLKFLLELSIGLEWRDTTKLWVGMKNPCNEVDMSLFYAAIIGNEKIAQF
jgi:hypothetical protein